MESNQVEHWKLFHKEKAAIEHAHLIQGVIMSAAVLVGPFMLLWVMAKIFGQ
jgi:hypothetical protein